MEAGVLRKSADPQAAFAKNSEEAHLQRGPLLPQGDPAKLDPRSQPVVPVSLEVFENMDRFSVLKAGWRLN